MWLVGAFLFVPFRGRRAPPDWGPGDVVPPLGVSFLLPFLHRRKLKDLLLFRPTPIPLLCAWPPPPPPGDGFSDAHRPG